MLDKALIFSRTGLVLWQKVDHELAAGADPVDHVIRKVLLEERLHERSARVGTYTIKWVLSNSRDLVFAVIYQDSAFLASHHMEYVDRLLAKMKKVFVERYGEVLNSTSGGLDFDETFVELYKSSQRKAQARRTSKRASTAAASAAGSDRKGAEDGNDGHDGGGSSSDEDDGGSGGEEPSDGARGVGAIAEEPEEDSAADGGAGDPAAPAAPALPSLLAPPVRRTPTKAPASSTSDGSGDEDEGTGKKKKKKNKKKKKKKGASTGDGSAGGASTPGSTGAAGAGGDDDDGAAGTGGDTAGSSDDGGDGGGTPGTPEDVAARARRLAAMRGGRRRTGAGGGYSGRKVVAKPRPVDTTKVMASRARSLAAPADDKDMANFDMSKDKVDASAARMGGGHGSGAGAGAPLDPDLFSSGSDTDPGDTDSEEEGKEGGGGWFSTVFNSLTGNRVLEEEDLREPMEIMQKNLQAKNVAAPVAEDICKSVLASLSGKKLAAMTRVTTAVKEAMRDAVERILTAQRSTNVLQAVRDKKRTGEPYTIVFVGVNGVGKSTSLSKVCYHLKSNGNKVMIAACDTFRSGAVEQLAKHCRTLDVHLFQQGYKSDASSVARAAIVEAKEEKYDVVLVDTAGRMQNNEPLMRSLAKLISENSPDLVLFVGEALVGNDGVDQLTSFDRALHDTAFRAAPRTIDGIVLTKFDTIDDKVGAALSMVYMSKKPIFFIGTGQKYTHLKELNVKSVVKSLCA